MTKFMNPILALVLALVGQQSAAQETVIKADGSSTVFPIMEAAGYEFQKKTKTRVTVGISGTGGGFKKFCDGQTDVQNASRPILKEEMEKCNAKGIKYLEIPIAYDALVIVVNPANDWVKSITTDELKRMWEPAAKDTIMTWKQVNSAWPNTPLKLFGAGTDSGTFDYFTEAINGKSKQSRPDYSASEDDNTLVQGVSSEKGALGYFGYAYYLQNKGKLRALLVDGGSKAPKKGPVGPSVETVKNATYFPLSRPLFVYVSQNSFNSRPEVKAFTEFLIAEGAKLSEKAKYIPLPEQAYKMAKDHISKGKIGTVFGGEAKVGLKVEDLLKMETKL